MNPKSNLPDPKLKKMLQTLFPEKFPEDEAVSCTVSGTVDLADQINCWNMLNFKPTKRNILLEDHEGNLAMASRVMFGSCSPFDDYVIYGEIPFGFIKRWANLNSFCIDHLDGGHSYIYKTTCGVIINLEPLMVKDDELTFRETE